MVSVRCTSFGNFADRSTWANASLPRCWPFLSRRSGPGIADAEPHPRPSSRELRRRWRINNARPRCYHWTSWPRNSASTFGPCRPLRAPADSLRTSVCGRPSDARSAPLRERTANSFFSNTIDASADRPSARDRCLSCRVTTMRVFGLCVSAYGSHKTGWLDGLTPPGRPSCISGNRESGHRLPCCGSVLSSWSAGSANPRIGLASGCAGRHDCSEHLYVRPRTARQSAPHLQQRRLRCRLTR